MAAVLVMFSGKEASVRMITLKAVKRMAAFGIPSVSQAITLLDAASALPTVPMARPTSVSLALRDPTAAQLALLLVAETVMK